MIIISPLTVHATPNQKNPLPTHDVIAPPKTALNEPSYTTIEH